MADELGAVRRTPRPTGDRQTPETVAQPGAGTTQILPEGKETDPPLSTRERLAELIAATDRHMAPEDFAEPRLAAPAHATAILAAGWRPPRPFEAPLAVHFAGPPVKAEGRRRQLCMWCGHVLEDVPVNSGDAAWPAWPVGFLVRIDGVRHGFPYDGGELPPGSCALPDDEKPAGPWTPTVGDRVSGVSTHQIGQPTVTGWFLDSGVDGLSWLKIHADDPETAQRYLVATDSLKPSPDDPGPDEAQETRDAADWPAEETQP